MSTQLPVLCVKIVSAYPAYVFNLTAVFLVTINKSKHLLCFDFIGLVRPEELAQGREEVVALIAELSAGFRVLADFTHLDSMSVGCAAEIGKTMELCEQKGVALVARVIPDQTKDIGLGILTHFHYRHPPPIANCTTMVEAAKLLDL